MQNDTIYDDVYNNVMAAFIWIEVLSMPITIACCVVWIIIAVLLLRKRDASRKESGNQNNESLRVHYVTALHRKRFIQYAILLIAVTCILTEITINCLTMYDIHTIFEKNEPNVAKNGTYIDKNGTKVNTNSTNEHIEYGHEIGQWYNYQAYGWMYILWLVTMLLFSQGFYWSIALVPITTKSYFNTQTNGIKTQNLNVFIFIGVRSIIIAILWLIPYTIPLGVILSILTIVFDWILIMFYFGSAYSVAKNNMQGILNGLDEMDAADSNFVPKVRKFFIFLCLFFMILMFTLLQFFVVEFILPMVMFPNCWIKPLYSIKVDNPEISALEKHNMILVQIISVLLIRVVICVGRGLLIALSAYAFFLIFKFQKMQKVGRKLKKVKRMHDAPAKESTPLMKARE